MSNCATNLEDGIQWNHEVLQSSLSILSQKTRQALASKLDSKKLILSSNKYHRDWRGLAETAELESSVIRSGKISYTEHCLHLWIKKGGSIQNLVQCLELIDRYDVIEDTHQLIYADYDKASQRVSHKIGPTPSNLDELQVSVTSYDSNIITTDDQKNINDGGSLQYYDALVLFADEDLDFVKLMMEKLEGEFNMKLCLKDRDLVGGLDFEISAVLRLIEERCARVIVVLSPAFLQSSANQFFTRFAHALSIDRRSRILIPCMYKPCAKPVEISFCHSLDYYRTQGYWDYWKKLADSINAHQRTPRIKELKSDTSKLKTSPPLKAIESFPEVDLNKKYSNNLSEKNKVASNRKLEIFPNKWPHRDDVREKSSLEVNSSNYSTSDSEVAPLNSSVTDLPKKRSGDGVFRKIRKTVSKVKKKKARLFS